VNALAPAEVTKVVLDPDAQRIEVVVPDEQQHIAIGRRGQNVRLASQLTGWNIDIISESQESDRRNEEFRSLTDMFVDRLNVEEMIAQLLATEGFSSVEELADTPLDEIAAIQGFDEEIAAALKERADQTLEEEAEQLRETCETLGLTQELVDFEPLSIQSIIKLGEQGVKSLDDLADLATDELIEMLPDAGLSEHDAGEIIMAARAHWFADEEDTADESADAETTPANERQTV
jgi:N utilization substance protein A